MEGQGFFITNKPPLPHSISLPVSSTTSISIPGKGSVHEPGIKGVTPGNGVITCPPVSVCQNVSTIGQDSLPTSLWYHIHASGLIGSPTVPRSLNEERL